MGESQFVDKALRKRTGKWIYTKPIDGGVGQAGVGIEYRGLPGQTYRRGGWGGAGQGGGSIAFFLACLLNISFLLS